MEKKCNCNEPYDSDAHEGGYPRCPVHDSIKFEEIPEPVGKFIMDQPGLSPLVTGNGYYWHYVDVITLLTRYLDYKKDTPQGIGWVKASEFKYELEVVYHAKFSDTEKGAGYFNDDGGGGHIFVWQDGADTFQCMFHKLLILDEGQPRAGEVSKKEARP